MSRPIRCSCSIPGAISCGPTGRWSRPPTTPQPPCYVGFAVASAVPGGEFLPVPDRWNLNLPEWDRYGARGDYPYVTGHWWDPYNQNVLKGDYPVLGKRTFFTFTGVSDSLLEGRNLPVPSGVSTERPGSERECDRRSCHPRDRQRGEGPLQPHQAGDQ